MRDTDLQERSIGTLLPGGLEGGLCRGDLIFWRGHVGIVADPETMVHASGHHMTVVHEPLGEALRRISAAAGPPTAVRRL